MPENDLKGTVWRNAAMVAHGNVQSNLGIVFFLANEPFLGERFPKENRSCPLMTLPCLLFFPLSCINGKSASYWVRFGRPRLGSRTVDSGFARIALLWWLFCFCCQNSGEAGRSPLRTKTYPGPRAEPGLCSQQTVCQLWPLQKLQTFSNPWGIAGLSLCRHCDHIILFETVILKEALEMHSLRVRAI